MTPQEPTDEHSNEIINPFANLKLLASLAPSKSYRSYSKQQQDDVISFIKDGHSLRKAEKVFGIPKSTMHCWLKKIHKDLTTQMEDNSALFETSTSSIRCTYSKELKDDVIGFVKDGNNLGTAKKVFGIPRSTMHHWLKKSFHNTSDFFSSENVRNDIGVLQKVDKNDLETNEESEKRKWSSIDENEKYMKNSQPVLNDLINMKNNQIEIDAQNHEVKELKRKRLKYSVRIIGTTQSSMLLNRNDIDNKLYHDPSELQTKLKYQTDHDYNHRYSANDHDYHKVH